jgi:hypothetical protein
LRCAARLDPARTGHPLPDRHEAPAQVGCRWCDSDTLRGTETYDLASCDQFVLVDEAAQDIAPSCGSVNARR